MKQLLSLVLVVAVLFVGESRLAIGCPLTREQAQQMAQRILTEHPDLINTIPYGLGGRYQVPQQQGGNLPFQQGYQQGYQQPNYGVNPGYNQNQPVYNG